MNTSPTATKETALTANQIDVLVQQHVAHMTPEQLVQFAEKLLDAAHAATEAPARPNLRLA